MMHWLRLYTEILDDPKVHALSPETFRFWIFTLCVARRCHGKLPSIANLGFMTRTQFEETERLCGELMAAGLLEKNGNGIVPHNWSNRQFASDDVNARVKRFRDKKSTSATIAKCEETLHATAPEQNRTEQNRTEKTLVQNGAFALTPAPSQAERTAKIDALFSEVFWPSVWNKAAKEKAKVAFRKALGALCRSEALTAPQAAQRLAKLAAAEKQRAEVAGHEWRANLHPATWLNGARWRDEVNETSRARSQREIEMDEMRRTILGGPQ